MGVLQYDLTIDQGSDYARRIPILDDADQPVPVAGWAAFGQIRKGAKAPDVLHVLDLTTTGTDVMLRIPGQASDAWTWSQARYDVLLVSPVGGRTRLLEGAVKVRPATTRGAGWPVAA